MNISGQKNCFGCGVCTAVCSKKIIGIRSNVDGFYEPYLTRPEQCTDCGLCFDVCSFAHQDLALGRRQVKAYGAWSREHAVRRRCSSGGVGFEVGRHLIGKGYKVVGCRYNVGLVRAEHYVATTVEELLPSIGSKYIQSYTVDAFKAVDRKEKYLVVGTPCQIDSFRRYVQRFRCEENFILMDFFCHAVPSMLAWKQYVSLAEKKVGKLSYVSWRNKHTGWHDSWAMGIDGEERGEAVNWHDSYNLLIREKKSYLNSRLSKGDIFYKLFLGDYCDNPACQRACRFKYDHSSADIRIGDAWGSTYSKDEDGVSAAIAFTELGDRILKASNINLEERAFSVVAEGQMRKNAKSAVLSPMAMKMLRSGKEYSEQDFRRLFFLEGLFHIPYRLKCKIKKALKSRK